MDELRPASDSVEAAIEYGPTPELGRVIESLFGVIKQRGEDLPEGSYTAKLMTGKEDSLLKKIGEEATEVVMAAKDGDIDQIRYESADLIYHLLVVYARWGLTPDDLARELAERFK